MFLFSLFSGTHLPIIHKFYSAASRPLGTFFVPLSQKRHRKRPLCCSVKLIAWEKWFFCEDSYFSTKSPKVMILPKKCSALWGKRQLEASVIDSQTAKHRGPSLQTRQVGCRLMGVGNWGSVCICRTLLMPSNTLRFIESGQSSMHKSFDTYSFTNSGM